MVVRIVGTNGEEAASTTQGGAISRLRAARCLDEAAAKAVAAARAAGSAA